MRPLIALLLLSAAAVAQTPPTPPQPQPVVPQAVITAPASVPAGTPLVLYADKSTATGLSWKLITPKVAYLVFDQGGRASVLLVIPNASPGSYKFALVATGSAGAFDFDFAEVPVVAPDPTPAPTPQPIPPAPAPIPTPPPIPFPSVAKPFVVTLVQDSSAPSEAVATLAPIAGSRTVAGSVAALGGRWTKVDVTSTEYGRRKLAPHLAADDASGKPTSAPCVVVQDATGKVLKKAPCPPTEAALVAYLKSLTGAN